MKIALNMNELNAEDGDENAAMRRLLQQVKEGDYQARDTLYNVYTPFITKLAQKRTRDVNEVNNLIEKGRAGLLTAAKKFKLNSGPEKFKLFALDYIEKNMDAADGGFLSRLFHKS
jgi:DNA-directed RNA polymerase specialized sigma subunit